MWGNQLRIWFELFAGMAIHRPSHDGRHVDDGWINPNDIESRFRLEQLRVQGRTYNPNDLAQRNHLFNAIIGNAGALCSAKLLERRRQITPPSLDYRVTRLGRKVDNWGYGDQPGFRKRLVFFAIETWLRLRRYWKVVAIGAAGWAVLNAAKFYSAAWHWISNDLFALASAVFVATVLWLAHKAFSHG
jgi:hypothetical protein